MSSFSGPRLRWWTCATAAAVGISLFAPVPSAAPVRLTSRYWTIDPQGWKTKDPDTFPESALLANRADFGIAFSGGGTRAAAATIGQLRGLRKNGWLAKAKYVSAVSGGSWTVVPFVYAHAEEDVLLGTSLEPTALTRSLLEAKPPKGSLALSVVNSRLAAHSAVEAGEFLAGRDATRQRVPEIVRTVFDRVVTSSRDRTFADLLRRVFLKPVLDSSEGKRYAWDRKSVDDFVKGNAELSLADFLCAQRECEAKDDPPISRPFPIVGGTIIATHPAYDYPQILPLEMTPLYSGVRQRFGPKLGGAYIRPFTYGTAANAIAGDEVMVTEGSSPFTLADMIAISGAAPLLTLYLGQPHPLLKQGVQFFPTFKPFTVVDKELALPETSLSHGDGGFRDNLGLTPLLARGVRNIIVFVNAKGPVAENATVESFFRTFDRKSGSGDLSGNKVFDQSLYWELRRRITDAAKENATSPPVYCGTNWTVEANEVYNIRTYSGLNICWVYNQKTPAWERQLPADAQALLRTRRFDRFPWFRTFGENRPRLIRLNPAQVNTLAHLAEWTVTNQQSKDEIARALSAVLGSSSRPEE